MSFANICWLGLLHINYKSCKLSPGPKRLCHGDVTPAHFMVGPLPTTLHGAGQEGTGGRRKHPAFSPHCPLGALGALPLCEGNKHPPWQPRCAGGYRARVARASGLRGAMPKDRWPSPSAERPGAWFAHVGGCQSQPESTTSSALKQAQDAQAAQHMEGRLPLTYRAREQRAVNNSFPFSSHDNRHCLQNVGEYFDFGMGRRKVEPERRQQNSQNFFLWAHESVPSSEDGLTIYQTSFVKDQNTESPFCRRYPKHHTEESRTDKSAPENGKNMQPNKSS